MEAGDRGVKTSRLPLTVEQTQGNFIVCISKIPDGRGREEREESLLGIEELSRIYLHDLANFPLYLYFPT